MPHSSWIQLSIPPVVTWSVHDACQRGNRHSCQHTCQITHGRWASTTTLTSLRQQLSTRLFCCTFPQQVECCTVGLQRAKQRMCAAPHVYCSFVEVLLHHFQLPVLGSIRFERSPSGQATSSGVVEGVCGVGLRAKHLVGRHLQVALILSSSNTAYRMEACSVDVAEPLH